MAQGIVVTTLFIGSLVIFIGSLLQGAIGFGFSMVTVPFLVLLLPRTVMTPVCCWQTASRKNCFVPLPCISWGVWGCG